MHTNKKYDEMTIYIEACESGSMFKNLKNDIKVYATTAANSTESSWGTYCPPDDIVNGEHLKTCLADLYSVNWMLDSEKNGMTETLNTQYQNVKKATTKSEVQQFGDTTIATEPIGNFEGELDESEFLVSEKIKEIMGYGMDLISDKDDYDKESPENSVHIDQYDAYMHHLYAKVLYGGNTQDHMALVEELSHRVRIDDIFAQFALITGINTKA